MANEVRKGIVTGKTEDVRSPYPIDRKFEAFNKP